MDLKFWTGLSIPTFLWLDLAPRGRHNCCAQIASMNMYAPEKPSIKKISFLYFPIPIPMVRIFSWKVSDKI